METSTIVLTTLLVTVGILFVIFLIIAIVYIKRYNTTLESCDACGIDKKNLTSKLVAAEGERDTCSTQLTKCNKDLKECSTPLTLGTSKTTSETK